ncbi:MAG TPA: O-antigen ligase family protein [Candidatus Dormibacteraeota bacterium]|nr:O-antigen ligase family protein [Candidatus Dormibacteraeota bacterium]
MRASARPAAVNQPIVGTNLYRATLSCAALTCALLPWYTVRWHYGPVPTTLLETAIVLTVAVFAVESWRYRLLPEWRTAYTLPAALFIVAGAVSVVVAPDRRAALGLYRAYILEPIAFYVVVSFVVRRWSQARWILAGLALSAVTVCLPNIYVVLQAWRHHTLNVAVAPPVVIYQSANSLALLMVPLIAVGAALAVHSPDRRDQLASGLFLVIGIPATLLTFSRGAYLALLVIAVLLALTHPARLWLVAAIVIVAIAVSRVPPVASRLAHEINPTDPNNSLEERIRLWGATLRMMHDHPIFGTGLSGFKSFIDRYRSGSYAEDLIYPHNIVLNFWTETGVLGLAAFGWIMAQAVRIAWKGWRRGVTAWKPLQLGILLMLVGIVVHGLVDVPYWKNDLSMEFWVLVGLSWAGYRWAAMERD